MRVPRCGERRCSAEVSRSHQDEVPVPVPERNLRASQSRHLDDALGRRVTVTVENNHRLIGRGHEVAVPTREPLWLIICRATTQREQTQKCECSGFNRVLSRLSQKSQRRRFWVSRSSRGQGGWDCFLVIISDVDHFGEAEKPNLRKKMTSEEYSDVRRLYKYAMAHDAITEISKACEYLIAAGTPSTAPEYYAMAAGIVTMYGRPFTDNSRIGTISTSLVPPEFQTLHSTLIDLRHKAFAHTDFSGQLPGHGKMTEVRFVYDGKSVANFSRRPIFEPVLLPHIKALSDLLAQKVKESHDNFLNRILKVILPTLTRADVGTEF